MQASEHQLIAERHPELSGYQSEAPVSGGTSGSAPYWILLSESLKLIMDASLRVHARHHFFTWTRACCKTWSSMRRDLCPAPVPSRCLFTSTVFRRPSRASALQRHVSPGHVLVRTSSRRGKKTPTGRSSVKWGPPVVRPKLAGAPSSAASDDTVITTNLRRLREAGEPVHFRLPAQTMGQKAIA